MKHKIAPILLLILLALSFKMPIGMGSGENWWNGDWHYRKAIKICNATAAGSDYQVNITCYAGSGSDSGNIIYLENGAQAGFADVRFIDIDNTTELDYRRESYISSTWAKFWVEIQDNLSSSNVTIWIYWGNSSVSTTSNGTNTFMFFEDFEGSSEPPDGWSNNTVGTSTWDELTQDSKYKVYNFQDDNSHWHGNEIYQSETLTSTFCIAAQHLVVCGEGENKPQHQSWLQLYDSSSVQAYIGYLDGWTSAIGKIRSYITGTQVDTSGYTFASGTYLFEIKRDGTYIKTYYNSTLAQSKTESQTFDEIRFRLTGGASSSSSNPQTELSWVYVRKFVDPEPWICETGALEYAPMYPQYDNLGVSTHQANTQAVFHANWSSGMGSMDYYIYGSNVSGDWQNETQGFAIDKLPNASGTASLGIVAVWDDGYSAFGQAFNSCDPANLTVTNIVFFASRRGAPTGYLQARLYAATGTYGSDAVPTGDPLAYSETIDVADLVSEGSGFNRTDFAFNSSNQYTLTANTAYCAVITAASGVGFDPTNNIRLFYNAISSVHDGNGFSWQTLGGDHWEEIASGKDVCFEVYSNSQTWSNITKTLPMLIGQKVGWQIWANNTLGYWNTTGLQTFLTVGVNFTFYYTLDGILTIYSESRSEGYMHLANGSSYGLANNTVLNLWASPRNASYYWQNFTYNGNSELQNYANITIALSLEGSDLWCYFAETPTAGAPPAADYTDPGDVAEMMLIGLIFIPMGMIIAFLLIMKWRH